MTQDSPCANGFGEVVGGYVMGAFDVCDCAGHAQDLFVGAGGMFPKTVTESRQETHGDTLVVTVNDLKRPSHIITFDESEEKARHWRGLLRVVVRTRDEETEERPVPDSCANLNESQANVCPHPKVRTTGRGRA